MKISIIKQAGAFFAPAFFLLCLTSSTVMDKKESTATLEVRVKDAIQINPVENESKQLIGCHVEIIKAKPTKSSSIALMEKQRTQIHLTQQDSCIVISQ